MFLKHLKQQLLYFCGNFLGGYHLWKVWENLTLLDAAGGGWLCVEWAWLDKVRIQFKPNRARVVLAELGKSCILKGQYCVTLSITKEYNSNCFVWTQRGTHEFILY